MFRKSPFCIIQILIVIPMMLLSLSTSTYAKNKDFDSPCFDISLVSHLNLVTKVEKNNGFYLYVFASSNKDNAELQTRIIVSNKKPEAGQSLEDFQTTSIGAMSVMFVEAYKLYQYMDTPENRKVLSRKPYKLSLGGTTFSGATMYFGNIDASFLVVRPNDKTYAVTLVSQNSNEQIRKKNLEMLKEQLQSIKFKSCA